MVEVEFLLADENIMYWEGAGLERILTLNVLDDADAVEACVEGAGVPLGALDPTQAAALRRLESILVVRMLGEQVGPGRRIAVTVGPTLAAG